MAHSAPCQKFTALTRGFKRLQVSDPLTQCLAPRLSRSYATHTDLPTANVVFQKATRKSPSSPTALATSNPVITTLHEWPSMQPTNLAHYPAHELDVPLRRDILHRAVIYEGDNTRQGSASTKHRTQVRGSSRKVRPQKGTGSARLSDRKSPSMRSGGVAHGPHPRDFGTELPKKIYDLAWRTALSYRYKKGELIVLENKMTLPEQCTARWLNNFFINNGWGKGNSRTLVVRSPLLPESLETGVEAEAEARLLEGVAQIGEHVKLRSTDEVDVKDLLSCGRVIIEKDALDSILSERSRSVTV